MLQSLAFAVVASQMLAAAAVQSPRWEANYGKALAETRATDDQPLLVVLENPAKEAERVTTELLEVKSEKEQAAQSALNSYRICRVDVSTDYGKKVAEVFEAEKFPFVAIIDRTGSVILHSQAGQLDAGKWNEQLTRYQDGNQPVRVNVARPNFDSGEMSMPVYSTPSNYCPNCQRY